MIIKNEDLPCRTQLITVDHFDSKDVTLSRLVSVDSELIRKMRHNLPVHCFL